MVLLEEDQAERNSLRQLKVQTKSLLFSDGSLQLNTKLPFLLGTHLYSNSTIACLFRYFVESYRNY